MSKPPGNRDAPAMQRKGQRRRAEILRTARKIFVEEGYSNMTIRNICETMDISMGTLHYYFDRKSAVLHALVEETVAHYDERFRELSASLSDDPRKKFFALVDFIVQDIKNRETRRFFVQLYSVAMLDSEIERYRAGFHRFAIEQILSVLKELPENRQVEGLELKKRAALLSAQIEGLMIFMGTNPRSIPNMSKYLEAYREKALLLATAQSADPE